MNTGSVRAPRVDATSANRAAAGTPPVTVVIPTIGRSPGLVPLVHTLRSSGWPDLEIIVVDNRRTPSPALPALDPADVIVEAQSSASAARNAGADRAAGDIIVFLDDDVTITARTLPTLVAPIATGRAEVTVTKVVLDPAVIRPAWLRAPLLGFLSNYDRGTTAGLLADDDYGLTAAMAVDRSAFETAGGFWTRLGPTPDAQLTNDDVQLCRALVRSGSRIWYEPDAGVVHALPDHRLRRRWVVGRAWQQGRSDWLLEREWEGRPSGVVLGERARRSARGVVDNLRRLGRDPGTPTRVVAELARLGGCFATAVTKGRP